MKHWTAEERQALRNAVPVAGLDAKIAGRSLREIAGDVLKLSRAGLAARAITGCKGRDETQFLDVLDESIASGQTLADELIAHYRGDWNGDVTRVFRDYAY